MAGDKREILRRLTNECRAELEPINIERLHIFNVSLRPMYVKDGKIEYGPYPPDVQAYLDHLDKRTEVIIHRYEKMASAQTQPNAEVPR